MKIRKPNIQKMKRAMARHTHDMAYYISYISRDDLLDLNQAWVVREHKEFMRDKLRWWEARMKTKYVNPETIVSFFTDFDIDYNHHRFVIEGRVRPINETRRRYNPRAE